MNISQILLRVRPIELAELLKRLLGISRREVSVRELKLWLDPASNFGNRVITEGTYEPDFTTAALRLLQPGGCFVDLGANEGWFSLNASRVCGPRGRIFAIEPQQRLWAVILQNLVLNKATNCTLVPYAVGEEDRFIELILHPSLNTGATTAVSDFRRSLLPRQRARALPLSHIMELYSIAEIDLLKIDIERFELHALKSLGARLQDRSIKRILIEFHPKQLAQLGQSVADVVFLLKAARYEERHIEGVPYWESRP